MSMSESQEPILAILEAYRVVPVVTLSDTTVASHLAECLLEEGLPLLEVTLRTPEAFGVIEVLRHRFPSLTVAAGTVVSPGALREVGDLGVAFAVSPGCSAELLSVAGKVGIPFLPGVATPSEVIGVLGSGRTVMKVFPVTQLGGKSYLKTLGSLFGRASFCPTGGIRGDELGGYLGLPGVIGLGGSWMCSRALLEAGDWSACRAQIRETVSRVREWEEVA